jgi:serine/threonine-protein kinase RsbW
MGKGVTVRFRRQADTVPRVRGLIGHELFRCGAGDDVVDRLVLASAEACNNAILHSASRSYVVTVDIDTNICTITVSDEGSGFDVPQPPVMPGPESAGRRGLALMDALVDQVNIDSSTSGTTVVLRQRLGSNGRPPALAL